MQHQRHQDLLQATGQPAMVLWVCVPCEPAKAVLCFIIHMGRMRRCECTCCANPSPALLQPVPARSVLQLSTDNLLSEHNWMGCCFLAGSDMLIPADCPSHQSKVLLHPPPCMHWHLYFPTHLLQWMEGLLLLLACLKLQRRTLPSSSNTCSGQMRLSI